MGRRGSHIRYGGGQERITQPVMGWVGEDHTVGMGDRKSESHSRYRGWAGEDHTTGIGVGRRGSHSRYGGGQERITQQVEGWAGDDHTKGIGVGNRGSQQV